MFSLAKARSADPILSPLTESLKVLWHNSTSVQARANRAAPLLIAIVAMNIADLVLTLTYATSIGMGELNPLARLLMQHATVPGIIFFKLATMSLGCGLLFFTRRAGLSELATWIAFFGLILLTIRWVQYIDVMHDITTNIHLLAEAKPGDWIEIRSK